MNTVNNKRYKNTESEIQEAFMTLLKNKDINDISVKDICKIANISRTSFYSHYDDINDLIIKSEYEKSDRISELLAISNPLTVEHFINYVNYIKANKSFYIAYFKCENNLHISEAMMKRYISVNEMDNTAQLRYHMLFFMAGLKAVTLEWLNNDCPEDVGKIAQILFEQYLLFLKN